MKEEERRQQQRQQQSGRMTSDRVNTLAGICAGAANALAIAPLDVARVRLQAQRLARGESGGPLHKYHGARDTLRTIFREEGVAGLFRGLSITLLGYGPTWGIYFTIYNRMKLEMEDREMLVGNPDARTLVSSVVAGGIANVVMNPIWVVRTRMQTQEHLRNKEPEYKSGLDALKKMVRHEGWQSLFKGLPAQMLGLINVAITFPLYERLKKFRIKSNREDNPLDLEDGFGWYFDEKDFSRDDPRYLLKLGTQIMASSVSKAIASTITYPLEVIRTRHHIQVIDSAHPAKYKSALQTIRLIIKEEGVRALYAGLSTNLIRVVPASAVTLTTFEYTSVFLHDKFAL